MADSHEPESVIRGLRPDGTLQNVEMGKAQEHTQKFLDGLTADKGKEYVGYVILVYNIRMFNQLLQHQDQDEAANALSGIIGNWVERGVLEMCEGDTAKALARLRELTQDCEAMERMVYSEVPGRELQ